MAAPDERLWARALLGLAALDTLYAIAFVVLVAVAVGGSVDFTRTAAPQRPRLGVRTSPDYSGPGAQIEAVLTDSVAYRAGLRPGDLITAIDGVPMRSAAETAATITAGQAGIPRVLSITRANHRLDITVVPGDPAASGRADLFQRWLGSECPSVVTFVRAPAGMAAVWVAAVVTLGVLLVLRRLRGPGPPLWRWVVLALGGGVVLSLAVSHAACTALGGPITGSTLVGGFVQTSVVLLVASLAYRTMHRRGLLAARLEPLLATSTAIGRGALYLLTLVPRVQIVLLALVQLTERDIGGRSVVVEAATLASGWDAKLLLAVTVIVLAPVGEELLFRGVILPRLHPGLGTVWSVVVTSLLFAVLHAEYGVRMVSIFVLSLILCWARLRTGRLAAPITLHALTNAVSTLFLLQG